MKQRIANFVFLFVGFVALLFLSPNVFAGREKDVKLPPELEIIIAGWENNLSKINMVGLKGTIKYQSSAFKQAQDREGNTFDNYTKTFSIWKKGNLIKESINTNRDYSFDKKEIKYSLPALEFIHRKGELDIEKLKREKGFTGTTTETIVDIEQLTYTYEPKCKIMYINKDPKNGLLSDAYKQIIVGRYISGTTFPKYVKALALAGNTFSVNEPESGLYEVVAVYKKEGRLAKTIFQIDSNKGYGIKSIKILLNDEPYFDSSFNFTEVDGCWLLTQGETKYFEPFVQDSVATYFNVDTDSIINGDEIAEDIFVPSSLEIKKGTYILNKVTGEEKVYDDLTIGLRIDLYEAERNLLKLPDFESVSFEPTDIPKKTNVSNVDSESIKSDVKNDEIGEPKQNTGLSTSNFRLNLWLLFSSTAIGLILLFVVFKYRRGFKV